MSNYKVIRLLSLEAVAEFMNENPLYNIAYIERKKDDFHGAYYEVLLKRERFAKE